jgi:hypothetical protein
MPLKTESFTFQTNVVGEDIHQRRSQDLVEVQADEVLEVSYLRSSTNIRCIHIPRAPVERTNGTKRFIPRFQQHDAVRMVERSDPGCTFQTWEHTHEGDRGSEGKHQWVNVTSQISNQSEKRFPIFKF